MLEIYENIPNMNSKYLVSEKRVMELLEQVMKDFEKMQVDEVKMHSNMF